MLLLPMMSKRIRRIYRHEQRLNSLMLSHYFIALGFFAPTLTPTESSGNKEKHAHWVPSSPIPGINRGKVPVP